MKAALSREQGCFRLQALLGQQCIAHLHNVRRLHSFCACEESRCAGNCCCVAVLTCMPLGEAPSCSSSAAAAGCAHAPASAARQRSAAASHSATCSRSGKRHCMRVMPGMRYPQPATLGFAWANDTSHEPALPGFTICRRTKYRCHVALGSHCCRHAWCSCTGPTQAESVSRTIGAPRARSRMRRCSSSRRAAGRRASTIGRSEASSAAACPGISAADAQKTLRLGIFQFGTPIQHRETCGSSSVRPDMALLMVTLNLGNKKEGQPQCLGDEPLNRFHASCCGPRPANRLTMSFSTYVTGTRAAPGSRSGRQS